MEGDLKNRMTGCLAMALVKRTETDCCLVCLEGG